MDRLPSLLVLLFLKFALFFDELLRGVVDLRSIENLAVLGLEVLFYALLPLLVAFCEWNVHRL